MSDYTAADCKKLSKQMDEITSQLDFLEELGIKTPSKLVKSLNKVSKALDACEAVGEAMDEVVADLEKHNKSLYKQCGKLSAGRKELCESKVTKSSLPNAIKKTLDISDKNSILPKAFWKLFNKWFGAKISKAKKLAA
jgi:DNA repair ATPase RecN